MGIPIHCINIYINIIRGGAMNIDKAIRKQRKSYKIFMLTMSFIFLILPTALFATELHKNLFLLFYMAIIELLVAMSMFIRANHERLEFEYGNNKLKISVGLIRKNYIIFCDKIALVHTEDKEDDFSIIIVTTLKFRNKKIRLISKEFLKRYPYAGNEYLKLKKKEPEKPFYYIVIKKGGLKKYLLLNTIYKNSVKAVFTDEAIENIKKARGL